MTIDMEESCLAGDPPGGRLARPRPSAETCEYAGLGGSYEDPSLEPMSSRPPLVGAKRFGLTGLAVVVLAGVVLALGACASGDEDSSKGRAGRLMFSRFDEATHTFISTHTAQADGSDEEEISLPGPEGGGRWSRSGDEIAVMTLLPDDRVGTAIIEPDGTVVRTLEIADKSLNLVCKVWSPDDKRLACEGWDEADPSRNGIYTVRSSDGADLQRLTTTPQGVVDIPGDYSPDGAQFVFKRSADEQIGPLLIMDIPDGEPRPMSKAASKIPGVPGYGAEAGRPLAEHPDVAMVAFTGSTVTGKAIMAAAAQSNLKRVALELGGKSPIVVFDDGDLDAAASAIAWGVFYNSGETCHSPTRIIAERRTQDALVEKVGAVAKSLRQAHPLDPATQIGALIEKRHLGKVMGLIAKGREEGASLRLGGNRVLTELGGYYVEPTIFADARNDMTIAREEIFGPVLTFIPFDRDEEALAIANDTIYGLGAGIFTSDMTRAHRFSEDMQAGTVWINAYELSTSRHRSAVSSSRASAATARCTRSTNTWTSKRSGSASCRARCGQVAGFADTIMLRRASVARMAHERHKPCLEKRDTACHRYAWPYALLGTSGEIRLRYARPDPERGETKMAATRSVLDRHRYRSVIECLSKS